MIDERYILFTVMNKIWFLMYIFRYLVLWVRLKLHLYEKMDLTAAFLTWQ